MRYIFLYIGSFIIGYISTNRSTNSLSDLLANQEYDYLTLRMKRLQSHLGVTVGQPKSYWKLRHFIKIIRTDTEFHVRKTFNCLLSCVLRDKEMKKIRRDQCRESCMLRIFRMCSNFCWRQKVIFHIQFILYKYFLYYNHIHVY